ncbi:MAG: sialate O-acetylesterase [Victivallaceae bacterium]|nr:sialate O-acetylesterase [Victivallaceae bacterium]
MQKFLSIIVLSISASILFGEGFKVADVFSDHMVLQRQKPVPVWGWTEPGQKVNVEFKGQKLTATAYKDGKWLVKFQKMEAASKPADMTISHSGGKIVIKDILVGEVWLCSGQSNMEWPVSRSQRAEEMLADADNPLIRLLKIPRTASGYPRRGINAKWQTCSRQSVAGFSAVGYYFGLELSRELKIPVGLIESAWSGTRIEPWTSPTGFAMVSQLRNYINIIAEANRDFQSKLRQDLPEIKKWTAEAGKKLADKKEIECPAQPFPAHRLNSHYAPTGLYGGMIAPLVPFAIRGVIWYQGEANIADGVNYFYKMQALINGWRKVWRQGDFPFYFVQIAPYNYGFRKLTDLWKAQYRAAEKIKNSALVFPGDIGNIRNIHPRRKYQVGKRLALLALANDYGKKINEFRSPVFKDFKTEGDKLIISFEHLDTILKTNDGKAPAEFTIAGKDEIYYPAKAEIQGKTIVLSSEKVREPLSAEYAWHNLAVPNLVSGSGLPVLPFRTIKEKINLALDKPYVCSDKNPWGWNGGLTNGSWGVTTAGCFATKDTDKFPKHVTVDLEKTEKIEQVKLGVPPFGSTKTVEIELSMDGKTFKKVGSAVFQQKKTESRIISFPAVQTRYVRLTFPDHHLEKVIYDPKFIFITELEVY